MFNKNFLFSLIVTGFLTAAIPTNIIYQGYVSQSGLPANFTRNFTFTLIPGTSYTIENVVVKDGLYTVNLPFPVSALDPASGYKLRVEIDGAGGPLTPDIALKSVPYAYYASSLEGRVHVNNGNVGIGITSPAAALHVSSTNDQIYGWVGHFLTPGLTTGNGAALLLGKAESLWQSAWIRYHYDTTPENTYLGFGHYGGGASMVMTKEGEFGIGTTSPTAALSVGQLSGTAHSPMMRIYGGTLGGTAGNELSLASFGCSSVNQASLGLRAVRTGDGNDYQTVAVGLGIDVDNSVSALNKRLYIHWNGNVGIGTYNPAGKLHVYDSVGGYLIADSSAAGTSQVRLLKDGALKWAMYVPDNSSDLCFFDTDNRIRIKAGGNVGIGAEPGVNKLYVNGNCYASSRTGGAIDVAEWIKFEGEKPQPGEVVSLAGDDKVELCNEPGSRLVAGIVSTTPHLVMGQEYAGDDAVMLALAGRVPVKVSGNVCAGDLLIAAGGGKAMTCETPAEYVGCVIGKATTDSIDGQVMVLVGLR